MKHLLTAALLLGSWPLAAQGASADSAAVVETMRAFRAALVKGDSAAALALLAPDLQVLESGTAETREEYRAHHLPDDIAFVRAVPAAPGPQRVVVRGDVAWVSARSESRGTFEGRAIDAVGVELAVLSREPDGWKIRAIHWSSRRRTPR